MNAGLPPFFTLSSGNTVRFSAVDPSTGADVAGVVMSNASLSVNTEGADATTPPVVLSPAYLPA